MRTSFLLERGNAPFRSVTIAHATRVAIEIADIDACHDALRARRAEHPYGPLGNVVMFRTGDPIGDRRVCCVPVRTGTCSSSSNPVPQPSSRYGCGRNASEQSGRFVSTNPNSHITP